MPNQPDQDPPGNTLNCWTEKLATSDYNTRWHRCDRCHRETEVTVYLVEAASGPGLTAYVCEKCRQFKT